MIDLNIVKDLALESTEPNRPVEVPQYRLQSVDDKFFRIPALHEEPLPTYIIQKLELVDRTSFTSYINLFKGGSTRIFAIVNADKGARFVAAIDYHESGNERTPGRGKHLAGYNPNFSPEFNAWLEADGEHLNQDGFLDFLRKWGYTITSHSDADLLEMHSNLEFATQGSFSSMIERGKGSRKLSFSEDVQGKSAPGTKQIELPTRIKAKTAIFDSGVEFEFDADVLYRVGGGKLVITIELVRKHLVIKGALDSIVKDIEAETEISVLKGMAEFK
jgi:uncharacterized protein YfdQ (DUF2303 family)